MVLANLNTHTLTALYEAFEPQEAPRIARKLEFHYTPKRASELNQAEVEFSVLCGECMGRAHFFLAMRLWMPRFLSAPRHHPMPIPKPFPLHPA